MISTFEALPVYDMLLSPGSGYGNPVNFLRYEAYYICMRIRIISRLLAYSIKITVRIQEIKSVKSVAKAMLFIFLKKFTARDSNKEGASEACGRKQSGGLFLPTLATSEARR